MWNRRLFASAQANRLYVLRALARLLAVTAVVLTGALTALAVWGVVALLGRPDWGARLLGGAAAIALVWAFLPRFDLFPPEEFHITSAEYPTVGGMIDATAAALGVARPTVLFSEQFAAGFARIGARRRPVVMLGHALLAILEPAEMVALAAHELAHMRDGSWSRCLVVRVPHMAAERAARLLGGRRPTAGSLRIWRALRPAALALTFPLHGLVWLFRLAQAWDAQIAEYEADRLAVQVAGRPAALNLLRKSHYYRLGVLQQAFEAASPRERLAALNAALNAAPACDLERLVRTAHLAPASLIGLHPHFAERTAHVAQLPDRPPLVVISAEEIPTLRGELAVWPQRFHELKTAWETEASSRPIPTAVKAAATA